MCIVFVWPVALLCNEDFVIVIVIDWMDAHDAYLSIFGENILGSGETHTHTRVINLSKYAQTPKGRIVYDGWTAR